MARTWRTSRSPCAAFLVAALLGQAAAIAPSPSNCPAAYLSYNASARCCPAGWALTVLDGSSQCQVFTCCTAANIAAPSCSGVVPNDPVQCGAIGDIYYADGTVNRNSWGVFASGTPRDLTSGLTSPASGGAMHVQIGNVNYVTELGMWLWPLSGSIPASIGLLTALTYLEMRGNSLTGTIPDVWSGMTALVRSDSAPLLDSLSPCADPFPARSFALPRLI